LDSLSSRRLFYAALVSLAALVAVDSYLPLAASANPFSIGAIRARFERYGGTSPEDNIRYLFPSRLRSPARS
jgi:hypothetical protein